MIRSGKAGIVIFILLIVLAVIHLLALGRYPLPWFDESLFASIAYEFKKTGKLFPMVCPHAFNFQEAFAYGPVYFSVLSAFYEVLGFGSVVTRLPGFLAGCLMMPVLIKIFKHFHKAPSSLIHHLFLLTLLYDYSVFESFHLGRMETLAMLFIFLFTLSCIKISELTRPGDVFASPFWMPGLFALLTVACTPRPVMLLFPPLILVVSRIGIWGILPFLRSVFLPAVFVFVSYAFWIRYAFEDLDGLFNYYELVASTGDFSLPFNIRASVYVYQYPVYLAALVLIFFTIIYKPVLFKSPIVWISVLSIILFYWLVAIKRPYGVFVIPYAYLLTFYLFAELQRDLKNRIHSFLTSAVFSLLIILMVSIGLAKGAYIFHSYVERDPKPVKDFISKNIPKGSKVVGDEIYYFSVLESGSDFQYFNWYGGLEYRERLQREKYKYQYFMISDVMLNFQRSTFEYYLSKGKLEQVARLVIPDAALTKMINNKRPGLVSYFQYSGTLYRRPIEELTNKGN
jgi:hypothetical protein